MTASVGGEAKDKEKETTPVEDAKPGVGQWVTIVISDWTIWPKQKLMFVALVMEWCAMCVLGVCGRPGVHGPGDPRDWRLWPHHQVLGGAHRSLHPHAAAPRQPGEPNLQQNPVSNIYSGFALDKGTGDADVFCSRWTVWQSPVTAACWPREATSTSGCSTSPLATSTPWSTTAASARTWWRSGSR